MATGAFRDTASARNAVVINVSGGNQTLASGSRGIYIGGDGDVVANLIGGATSITFTAVKAGTVLPIQASAIIQTGTTATALLALY